MVRITEAAFKIEKLIESSEKLLVFTSCQWINKCRTLSIHGIDRAHLILDALSLANIITAWFLVTFDS